jgi:drug/metabolite transporter (DMT)-like permease
MSAGIAALIISTQPLLTAAIASRWMGERLAVRQWAGVVIGLAGVVLVVWHKIDIRDISFAPVLCTIVALSGVTAATLYQRTFSPGADLKAAAVVQFAASLVVLAPLAVAVEGFQVSWAWPMLAAIAFLVILASLFGVSVLHILMRHGEATRVTSLLYLPPIFALAAEIALFGVVPTGLTFAGVAMVAWRTARAPQAAPAE